MSTKIDQIAKVIVFGFCPFSIFLIWLEDEIEDVSIYKGLTFFQQQELLELILYVTSGIIYFIAFLSLIIDSRNIFRTEKVELRLVKISNRILFFDCALLVSVGVLSFFTDIIPLLVFLPFLFVSILVCIFISFYNYWRYKTGGRTAVAWALFLFSFFFLLFQIWLAGMGI